MLPSIDDTRAVEKKKERKNKNKPKNPAARRKAIQLRPDNSGQIHPCEYSVGEEHAVYPVSYQGMLSAILLVAGGI